MRQLTARPNLRSPLGWLLLCLALLTSCTTEEPWRLVQEPWTPEALGEREDALVTLKNGDQVVLENARIVLNPWGSYVSGDGERGDTRRRQVELDQIHRIEARLRAPEKLSEYSDATKLIFVVVALIIAGLIWNNAEAH